MCCRVLGVQKLILPLLGAKTKVKKLGGGAVLAMSKGEYFFSVTPSLMMCIEIKFEGLKARLVRQENSGNWYVCSMQEDSLGWLIEYIGRKVEQ